MIEHTERYIMGRTLVENNICTFNELLNKSKSGEIQPYCSFGRKVIDFRIETYNVSDVVNDKSKLRVEFYKRILNDNKNILEPMERIYKILFHDNDVAHDDLLDILSRIMYFVYENWETPKNIDIDNVTFFPFSPTEALQQGMTEERHKDKFLSFFFLHNEIAAAFENNQTDSAQDLPDTAKTQQTSTAPSMEGHGFCSLVIRMRHEGKTDSEIATILRSKKLSRYVVGVLLSKDTTVISEQGFRAKCDRLLSKKDSYHSKL